MVVKVFMHDGTTLTPCYEPSHFIAVKEFYALELSKGNIRGYIIQK